MTSLDKTAFAQQPALSGDKPLLEEIRTVLNRPDLSDDILRMVLKEYRFSTWGELSATAFTAGYGHAEQRARLIRTMAVPAPRQGLHMPAHDLNPPLAVRFAAVAALWQRALRTFAPQVKRVPVPARNR